MTYKLEVRGSADAIVKDVLVTVTDKDGNPAGQFGVKWNVNSGAKGLEKQIELALEKQDEALAAQDEHKDIIGEVEAVLNADK